MFSGTRTKQQVFFCRVFCCLVVWTLELRCSRLFRGILVCGGASNARRARLSGVVSDMARWADMLDDDGCAEFCWSTVTGPSNMFS